MNKKFIIDQNNHKKRLDIFLTAMLKETRSQIKTVIDSGFVTVDKTVVRKNGFQVVLNNIVEVNVEIKKEKKQRSSQDEELEKLDIKIIYEDDFILVINKPSNLIIHDAPTVHEPTLVDWLRYKKISLSTISGEIRHGIVHRLDKGTSGAMVVAKTNEAHIKLSSQLKDKSMGRYYCMMINQTLKQNQIINKPLSRDRKNRIRISVQNGGKESKTAFLKYKKAICNNTEVIFAKLYTGRTHQIRAHLNFINRQIIGDLLYDFKGKDDKIYLHSFILYLIHPQTGQKMVFKASFDDKFKQKLKDDFNIKENDFEKIDEIYLHKQFNSFI